MRTAFRWPYNSTAANQHDVNTLLPLVVNIPEVAGKKGRPKWKPAQLLADKAFDCQALRDVLRWLGITPTLPRRGETEHGLWSMALVRRAHYQLAPSIPVLTHSLGSQNRSAPSLSQPGRRRHLLQNLDQ